jgi:predicted transposase YbfD/YdcC
MLQKYLEQLTDKRQTGKVKHNLLETVLITICAVMTGIDSWWQISDFARVKQDWLRERFGLALKNGVPSHDTFQRIFQTIDPKEFERCFTAWVRAVVGNSEGEFVAIDGKTVRGSRRADNPPLHLVSAWAGKNRMVLGQTATENKSNEITAIPTLLDILDLKGCIITIDAIGTQRDIAAKIISKENDYVLAVKENQSKLHEYIWKYFDECLCDEKLYFAENKVKTAEKGHGRIEIRKYYLSTDIGWIEKKDGWAGLSAIGMVESSTDRNGKMSVERRYYITTLTDVTVFAAAVRAHWGIENSLHWCLDVTFGEDKNTTCSDHAPENFAVVRKIALNLIRHYELPEEKDKNEKMSVRGKLKKCEYDCEFMSSVLLSCLTA